MNQNTWYRIAGAAAVIGLLAGAVGGTRMMYPPSLQLLLQDPVANGVVVVIALGTVLSLIHWAREPGHLHRRPFIAAILAVGGLAVITNLLAPAFGWWGGPVFNAPLLPLALLTGLKATLYLSLLLLLYRWLASRRLWLARLIYLLLLIGMIPATIFGDETVLRSGVLTFGGGYTIWHDVLFGMFLFALPPILYEVFCRYWHVPI